MACRKKTITAVLEACDCEKSQYAISLETGIAHMTVARALRELEKTGDVRQITDVVGSVYPRWVRV